MSVRAMTLEEAVESAIKNDPTLRASKLNQLATEENIAIAKARLMPQISLQGSTNQLTQTTTQDFPAGGSTSRSFTGPSVNHQLVLRQALIRPKELSLLRYAELQTEYMSLKYKYDLNELKSKVFNAWIELIASQQIANAYEIPLPLMEISARQELVKYEKGDGTKDAAIEAYAQYENAKMIHMQAEESAQVKKGIFEKIARVSTKELANYTFSMEPEKILNESEKLIISENFRNRSIEIQMAKLQELMQIERIKTATADHNPTFDLLAAINFAQNDATSTQGYKYKNKQIGIQYTIPIFNGGGISAATRQASFGYESSLVESEALAIKIENEFDSIWSQAVGGQARQIALMNLFYSSEEQLKGAERSLELGVKSISDVAIAKNAVARRKVDLINTILDNKKVFYKIKKFLK
jgi:protease secretion system outer membrane protein